tara:strand:- start:424 stop:1197 length:774 start_codon:yes stop_codon:yes gene_type:complete
MKPYLPVCALIDKDIAVEIDFYPTTYFSNSASSFDLSYNNTALVTEEVIVTDNERLYYRYQPQELVIETVAKLPTQKFNLNTPLVEQRYEGLVASFPVKMISWLFRSAQFENIYNSTEFLHRYNFSTVRSEREDYKLYFQFMKSADFYIEGVPQVQRFGTDDFYRYLQAIQGDLNSTEKNIYNYNFALKPQKVTPSGSLNMAQMSSNKTFFAYKIAPRVQSSAIEQIDLSQGATGHVYAFGYNVLKIENGFVTRIFS